ncbi:MAG: 1-acyl-sn-glycerol-3-phosphate acyltransferase [Bacilli bacterium]|nr:1-acyl-sn-glycerol-3-phosphate acyltransferase [Bacilli bacterium]
MKDLGYKLLKPFVITYYRIFFRPTVIGKENIPKRGPIILCGNHKHVHDQYNVMMVTKRVIHYMAKDEYFKGPHAWFYKLAGCISVDRTIHDEKAKRDAMSVLNEGGAVGIFPEGTRNKTLGTPEEVDLLPFKFGAVSLAKKTNALIVPFGISGDYTGKKGKLTTRIGEPFSVKDMDLEEANALLREKILKLMKKNK